MTKTDSEPSSPIPPNSDANAETKEDRDKIIAKDFLLAEHNVIKEFFQGDLKVSEKRVDFFVKISGGAIAFIGVLFGLVDSDLLGGTYIGYTQILIVGSFLALVLLGFGYSTLVRIAYMNVNHEKWKKRMGILRNKFRDLLPMLRKGYFPFRADHSIYVMREEPQSWGEGGLNSVMLRLNAIILVVLMELTAEYIRSSFSIDDIRWVWIPVLLAIFSYSGGFYGLKWVINRKSKEWEKVVAEYIGDIIVKTEQEYNERDAERNKREKENLRKNERKKT